MERLGFSKVTSRLPKFGFASAEPDASQPHRKQTRSNSNLLTTGGVEPSSEHGDEHTSTPRTLNVVLFGETGVGKSSVINLIARKDIAKVSTDIDGCTMESTRYDISFDGMDFAIFDTIGLEEPHYGVNGYLRAIEKAYELIMKLSAAGGIHLLLFCLRGGRITATAQSNYRLFCECLCSKKVPIALVFTGLEMEEEMENWWRRNYKHVEHYGIHSDGHACITAVQDDTPEQILKYTESKKIIRELLKDHSLKDDAFSPETLSWFARLGGKMKSFISKRRNPKKKDVMKVLTQRCRLDPGTAKRIVDMMEKEDKKEDKVTDEQKEVAGPPVDGHDTVGEVVGNASLGAHEGDEGGKDTDGDNALPNQLANVEAVPDESQVILQSFAEDHPLSNRSVCVEAGRLLLMEVENEVATTEPPTRGIQGEDVGKMSGGENDDAQPHRVDVHAGRTKRKDGNDARRNTGKPSAPANDSPPRGTGEDPFRYASMPPQPASMWRGSLKLKAAVF